MNIKQFLTSLDFTVTTNGVEFDDLIEEWGVKIIYDPVNSDNNIIELEYKEGTVKLSEAMEEEIFEHCHSLWVEELEAEQQAIDIKETNEHLNRSYYN